MKLNEKDIVDAIQRATDWTLVDRLPPTQSHVARWVFTTNIKPGVTELEFETTYHGKPTISLTIEQAEGLARLSTYTIAAKTSGYGVMKESNGRYTLHNTTDAHQHEQDKILDLINENIDLQQEVKRLKRELDGYPSRATFSKNLKR